MFEVGLIYALMCGDVSAEYKEACLNATKATSMQNEIHQVLEKSRSYVINQANSNIVKPVTNVVTDVTGKRVWAGAYTIYKFIKGDAIPVTMPKKWHGEGIDSIGMEIKKKALSTSFRWKF